MENYRTNLIALIAAHKVCPKSWLELIEKSPSNFVEQLSNELRQFFVLHSETANVNLKPLHVAAARRNFDLCYFITENTEDKNPRAEITMFPNFISFQFEVGISSGSLVERNVTPLHIAAANGSLAIFKMIMEKNQDKNPKSSDGWTPLHIAAMNGRWDFCKLIIDSVPEKNPEHKFGFTPFQLAAYVGNVRVCEIFLERIDEETSSPRTMANHGMLLERFNTTKDISNI